MLLTDTSLYLETNAIELHQISMQFISWYFNLLICSSGLHYHVVFEWYNKFEGVLQLLSALWTSCVMNCISDNWQCIFGSYWNKIFGYWKILNIFLFGIDYIESALFDFVKFHELQLILKIHNILWNILNGS